MKKLSIRTFIQNLYSLWVYEYHKKDNELEGRLLALEKGIKWLEIKNAILSHHDVLTNYPELQFVLNSSNSAYVLFPYKQLKSLPSIFAEYDAQLQLPYIIHKDKRLYYPKTYSLEACQNAYRFLIEEDQILEGGYLEKAPHCYQTNTFKVEEGDVLIDGGAAEGLFALSNIGKVSHVYLIESDVKWIPALEATFAPYKDKVTIINKYLSDTDDNSNVSLTTLLSKHCEPCFVKMDIEGAEPKVIAGSQNLLKSRNNVKLVCCSYHYQDDAEKLSKLFNEISYEYEFSDGWFFFAEYDFPSAYPFLRKAIIRSWHK